MFLGHVSRRICLNAALTGLTLSRDGKTFLYSQSVYTGKDLMLIENFR